MLDRSEPISVTFNNIHLSSSKYLYTRSGLDIYLVRLRYIPLFLEKKEKNKSRKYKRPSSNDTRIRFLWRHNELQLDTVTEQNDDQGFKFALSRVHKKLKEITEMEVV